MWGRSQKSLCGEEVEGFAKKEEGGSGGGGGGGGGETGEGRRKLENCDGGERWRSDPPLYRPFLPCRNSQPGPLWPLGLGCNLMPTRLMVVRRPLGRTLQEPQMPPTPGLSPS